MDIPFYSTELPFNNHSTNSKVDHFTRRILLEESNNTNIENYRNTSSGFTLRVAMNPLRNLVNILRSIFNLPQKEKADKKISALSDMDGDEIDHPHPIRQVFHTGIINRAYFPMRLTLMLLGRWPFVLELTSVARHHHHDHHHHIRGSSSIEKGHFNLDENGDHLQKRRHFIMRRVGNYVASLKSPLWIYFGLTTLFICFVLLMSTLGFFDFFLEWNLLPGFKWASLQKNTFRKNLVMFLLVWGCLLHSTLSSFAMFIDRKKLVTNMNFWNYAADKLQIDEVRSHRRFLIMANIGYVLFLVLIYVAYSYWNVRFVRDGAALFGMLTIQPWLSEYQFKNVEEWKLRVFGIAVIIYGVYASRAFLFIFCFKCRLLRSLFRLWNERLVKFLRKPNNTSNEKKNTFDAIEKVESERLLGEMTTLLKMVKQMDSMFATVLTSYYAIQLLNMCFELYMLAKSGSDDVARSGGANSRSLDIISALITLCQNVYFFFTVSLDGANVGEEAAKGLEAIRENPISPQSSVHRKYLVYNLGIVYNQKIAITGGKFFVIDRPFIITVLGAVLTYFVIILQVEPSLNKQNGKVG